MQQQEEKTTPKVPNINFIWTGALKPSSFEGPKTMANAKNDTGQSYSITYWVEKARMAEVKAELAAYDNIQVKSIKAAIQEYCCGDEAKEKRIHALLERCSTEKLPNVPKEILAPIIQSITPGYFFDTSIEAKEIINLPNLSRPALSRNLQNPRCDIKINDREVRFENKFKAEMEDLSPADLYAYFSATSPENEVSEASKTLFSRLAEDTFSTWEQFFEKGIPDLPPQLMQRLRIDFLTGFMINDVLLGPICRLYAPHKKDDDESVFVFDIQTDSLLRYNALTGMPLDQVTDHEFTTIDARYLKTTDKGGLRDIFCEGQHTGISKYIGGAWKKNFTAYLERSREKQAQELKEEAPKQTFAAENPNSFLSPNKTELPTAIDVDKETQPQTDKPTSSPKN